MGRGLIKIKDKYFEWSTIVDAPVTYAMSLEELKLYYKEEYGRHGMQDFDKRLKRTEETGTSFYGTTLDDLIACNRAGENEWELTKDEIYEAYKKP